MTDAARYKVIPPEQAVVELVDKLNALENKLRNHVAVSNAAKREINARNLFDRSGSETAFKYLLDAREALVALVESLPE